MVFCASLLASAVKSPCLIYLNDHELYWIPIDQNVRFFDSLEPSKGPKWAKTSHLSESWKWQRRVVIRLFTETKKAT